MPSIHIIARGEFDRLRAASLDPITRARLFADMCRANTLAAVKLAGSGHLGSSLSAMDILSWLYLEEMNTLSMGIDNPARDVYFSSKGHDVPGFYSLMYALGVIPEESLLNLRRLGGLDGHPDVGIPGVEANSGSLGMGISKGRGMAWAQRCKGLGGRVFVLTGDGEWQEGQNYEGLLNAVQQGVGNLHVIIDHNKVQSDRAVGVIADLGDLEAKLKAFGWEVSRCDGHDLAALGQVLAGWRAISDRPKILIADTIKGRGVSFMEHPAALAANSGTYPWHAGAPADEPFAQAHAEVIARVQSGLRAAGLEALSLKDVTPPARPASGVSAEKVAESYGQALLELAPAHPELVVLDADLAVDCRVRSFEDAYPERFIECGIAEQDMVSMAGGLALQGLLPVVNSFACFLASRANEQIYNNATEKTRIIYACHYAGLIPAGPGKSHQSLRDISLLAALPNMIIIQPANDRETRAATAWAVQEAQENVALRLAIGPSPRLIEMPSGYRLAPGRGTTLHPGADALLFAYGPVMLHEALSAAEGLAEKGFGLKVVNLPWLNRVDPAWLAGEVAPFAQVFVLDDHHPAGGLGDHLLGTMMSAGLLTGHRLHKLAVEGFPACGTPSEALAAHGLDAASLIQRIPEISRGGAASA